MPLNSRRPIQSTNSNSFTIHPFSCRVDSPIEIEISSQHCLKNYTYLITARGKILESKTKEFSASEDGSIDRLTFVPTFDCTPKLHFLVYILLGKSLCSKKLDIELNERLNNFIDLSVTPGMAKPGQVVELNVASNPKSYIALLGVDQSVLLLRSGNYLALDGIWNEIEMFHMQVSYARFGIIVPEAPPKQKKSIPQYVNYWEDFERANLIMFSNTNEPIRQVALKMSCDMMERAACFKAPFGFDSVAPVDIAAVVPKTRKEFPETWIWDSISDGSFPGELCLKRKVPDSLTSWILTGFSIDPERGLGITTSECKLQVYQPFFVSLSLPYAVKRGEVVNVPCIVFNYLQQQLDTEVTLENLHDEFDFFDVAMDARFDPESSKDASRKKKMLVFSNDGATASFAIRPKKIGTISLKVTAVSPIAGDAIIRTLIVEPEGVPQYENKTVLVDLRETSKIESLPIEISVPENALADSTRIEIQLVGDLLGGTIKNLEKLIRMPSGCGEQNMLNFVPNIVILNYLNRTHQLTPEIEAKAKRFMAIGYQRELTYKHEDGSFSAFGASDTSGSTWLTAFVAKSFQQASAHIGIDRRIIDTALLWLSKTQNAEGAFAEVGSICHKEMQGGSSNGVALTAYVLTAFLENEVSVRAHRNMFRSLFTHRIRFCFL